MNERREPGFVLLFSVLSCGLYLIYWYYRVYEELEWVTGSTPTGNGYWIDFFLNLITCSLYGIWVDYKISQMLHAELTQRNIAHSDSTNIAIILDISAYITGFFTNFLSSSIQQEQLNKLLDAAKPSV